MEKSKPLVFVVGDFGAGDLAFAEIKRKLRMFAGSIDTDYVTVEAFSTISTGFCIYQLALDGSKKELGDTYIFSNTAPRADNPNPRKKNEGERLVYAKLNTGLEIVAVLSGYTFSFIKPMIKELRYLKVENMGSQFRSRDKYPEPLSKVINKDYSVLGEKLDAGELPEPPRDRLAYVDGYGNMKLSTRISDLSIKAGSKIKIEIGGVSLHGKYAEGMFSVKEGEVSVAPGSSGPEEERFIEISVRLGNAWKKFGCPKIEDRVTFTPI